ncbi:hypothetical protein SEVIR_8G242600v4 [Setaria viridis]
MSPRATMRLHLLSLGLLLAIVATVPLVSAICISLHEKPESKSEAAAAAATGSSVKTLSLDEYGLPKKVAEKPKVKNPYEEATSAKASTAYEKPVEEDEKPDKYEESSAPKKVKKEKSDDFDAFGNLKKKKENSDDSAKKEKSDDSDVSEFLKKKKKKEKYDDADESSSFKKEKKEKSDSSHEHVSPNKKEKKEKSDGSDEYVSPNKKEKKKKSDDSDEYVSPGKKEKKEKSEDSDKDVSSNKKEKKEEAKKKEKSNDYFDEDKEEKSDEDPTPVDVSTTGEYVPPKEKSDEDATPVDVSAAGQYVPSAPAKKETSKSSTTTLDAYADASQQPMGGAPDEPLPAAKQSSAGTPDAYASPTAQGASHQQPMGGAPDEPLPAAKSSDQYAASGQQPMGGAPDEPLPAAKKPKLSMETFGGMIRKPIAKMLNPVVKRVCANTQYPEDCEASIAGLPGSVPAAQTAAADAIGVLRLAMEAVREKVVEAMNAATDRMNAPGTDATVKEALDDCTSSYSDIKSNLETVDDALKRGDLATARTNLDSVETDVTTCDDGFNERGTPSVMTDHDQELQKLASDLIAIGANSIHHA